MIDVAVANMCAIIAETCLGSQKRLASHGFAPQRRPCCQSPNVEPLPAQGSRVATLLPALDFALSTALMLELLNPGRSKAWA